MGQFVPTSMTGCISTAANHKPYNSTHTHTPQEYQDPIGHWCHVADRKQMACWGKKKAEKRHAKEGQRENASLPPFSLSIIPSYSVGRKRKTEAMVVFGWISGLWLEIRVMEFSGRFLNNSPAWLYCTGLCWDSEPAGYLRQNTSPNG